MHARNASNSLVLASSSASGPAAAPIASGASRAGMATPNTASGPRGAASAETPRWRRMSLRTPTTGPYGSPPPSRGTHTPRATSDPASRARVQSSSTSRVFPMPASPPTSTVAEVPPAARSRAAPSASSSSARPTNSGQDTRWPTPPVSRSVQLGFRRAVAAGATPARMISRAPTGGSAGSAGSAVDGVLDAAAVAGTAGRAPARPWPRSAGRPRKQRPAAPRSPARQRRCAEHAPSVGEWGPARQRWRSWFFSSSTALARDSGARSRRGSTLRLNPR